MKTINALAKHLASLEGKKSQARIHDIREILGILSDLTYRDAIICTLNTYAILLENGHRRSKRRKK